jgi:hypothetical protein
MVCRYLGSDLPVPSTPVDYGYDLAKALAFRRLEYLSESRP